jgi:hypothetical protein
MCACLKQINFILSLEKHACVYVTFFSVVGHGITFWIAFELFSRFILNTLDGNHLRDTMYVPLPFLKWRITNLLRILITPILGLVFIASIIL